MGVWAGQIKEDSQALAKKELGGFNLICVFSRGVAYLICFVKISPRRSADSGS